MSPLPPTSTSSTSTSTVVAPKKARVISKDLNRSPLRKAVQSKSKQRPLKLSTKFRGKARGRSPRTFKKNGPSNYEANIRVTHTFTPNAPSKKLTLRYSAVSFSPRGYKQLPAATSGLGIDQALLAGQRVLVAHYQPDQAITGRPMRTKRNHRLRLESDYRSLRCALTSAQRLRANYRAAVQVTRTRYWTSQKRSAALYVPDARRPGRRTRRKGRPRVGLTVARVQLARQLIRKFRASRGAKHTLVRRRLIRFR